MNRIYEEMFIVRPDITDEELNPLLDQLKSVVTSTGGTIDKEERMGVRRLAYRVQKRAEGYYILLQFTSGPTVVKELERRLRVSDLVMKFITVRMDEHLKRAAKLKKKKDARAARRPQVVTPAAPALAMPMAEVPGGPTPGAPVPGAPTPAPPVAPDADGADDRADEGAVMAEAPDVPANPGNNPQEGE